MRLAHMVGAPAAGPGMATDERIRFCTNCGRLSDPEPHDEESRPHRGRVCRECGLGVLLTTVADMLAHDGHAFVIVKSDLSITAASEAALEMLEADWAGVVGRPLLSVLDAPIRGSELARRAAHAANGSGDVSLLRIRTARGTHEIRVGTCGDPRGGLVVFA